MKRPTPAKPMKGVKPRSDGDEKKRFPDGLREVMRSIRHYRLPAVGPDGRPNELEEFCGDFLKKYAETAKRYGDSSFSADTDSGRKIAKERLLRTMGLLVGNRKVPRHVNFIDLRAFAEYAGGLPAGLLLIYSQITSEDFHDMNSRDMIAFLTQCQTGLDSLIDYINRSGRHPFINEGAGSSYMANLDGLRSLAAGFNKKGGLPQPGR